MQQPGLPAARRGHRGGKHTLQRLGSHGMIDSLSRLMRLRITGFTAIGEARIVDEHNRLVAFGELRVAAFTEPEPGDVFDVEVAITWVPVLREPNGEADWDAFPR